MQFRELGRTGVEGVSRFVSARMTFGDQTPQDDAFAQMDLRAWRAAMNFFDTAEMYASPPKRQGRKAPPSASSARG
jgi:aryl-alcohol dehydrogenase-like predicted oxidoreductase